MNTSEGLDQFVGELLSARFAAVVATGESCRTVAEQDERDREYYAALTGRVLPAPRDIRVALGYARVAADYRRRYGAPSPATVADESS